MVAMHEVRGRKWSRVDLLGEKERRERGRKGSTSKMRQIKKGGEMQSGRGAERNSVKM